MTASTSSRFAVLLALALGALACGEDAGGATTWRLVWGDEFDGPAGSPPDPGRWTREVGGHGWGNQELQHYTARRENVALDGAGTLVITARREPMGTRAFTSARLSSRGRFEQRYGRFEARLKLPGGQGLLARVLDAGR